MNTLDEVNNHRQDIRTEHYSMSIGELVSMYEDGELNVHPEFQRAFRWTPTQKSRLIESILLNIPIPSIFVAQSKSGKWDVIDGQQRLSTILQVMGRFRGQDGELEDGLVLESTNVLPSLKGKHWSNEPDDPNGLGEPLQLLIKRARLDVIIILRESSENAKYELFRRLNTGGASLSDQEKRSCLWLMENPAFLDCTERLAREDAFVACTSLSENQTDERYDLELVTRCLVLSEDPPVGPFNELSDLLDERSLELAKLTEPSRNQLAQSFSQAFDKIREALGDNCFRRYNQAKQHYQGAFSISSFEVLAAGTLWHIRNNRIPNASKLQQTAETIWGNAEFLKNTGSGIRASTRIPVTTRLGRDLLG